MTARRRGSKNLFGRKNLTGLLVLLVFWAAWTLYPRVFPPAAPVGAAGRLAADSAGLEVHILDVGQGSCALVLTSTYAALIDGGEVGMGQDVYDYLTDAGVSSLDAVIATHPHSDHIGGLTELVQKMPVKKLIMPGVPKKLVPNNGMYRDFLAALESEEIPIEICDSPQTVDLGGASLEIIGPFLKDPGNLNDCSLAVRVDARDASFLLMGDCEAPAEKALMASGTDLDTDILLAGHHGSDTSSTPAFLLAVTPMASAVSVGEGNSYGLPNKSIIARLLRFGPVYRTDLQDDIVFSTDGETISVSAGQDAAQEFSAAA